MSIIIKIWLPFDTKWNPNTATGFINAVMNQYASGSSDDESIFFVIRASQSAILWEVYIGHEENIDALASLVRTFYPDAECADAWRKPLQFPVHLKQVRFYRNNIGRFMPLIAPTSSYKGIDDPLIAVTNAIDNLEDGEEIEYRIGIDGYGKYQRGFWEKLVLQGLKETANRNNPWRYINPDNVMAMIEEKLEQKLVAVNFTVQMLTPTAQRFYVLDNLVAALSGASDLPLFSPHWQYQAQSNNFDEYRQNVRSLDRKLSQSQWEQATLLLTISELATLWHLPHNEMPASRIEGISPPSDTSIPEALHNVKGIYVGKSGDIDVNLPVDDRTTHTMIIGKTGTGKTTSMHHMITHDIENGYGVMVIDPTGNLVSSILAHAIPDNRIDDVVLLDFGLQVDGVRYPPPLNPLFKVTTEDGESRLAPELLTVMNRVYEDFEASQMGDLLEIALKYLAAEETPTLRDVRHFLIDDVYSKKLQQKTKDPILDEDWKDIKGDWKTIEKQSFRPLMRRLRSYYQSEQARAATFHPNALRISELVKEKKIVLINLSTKNTTLTEKELYVLGSMVVSQLFNTARRQKIEGKPFMLYIDETENFVTMPLADMLARARQYNIGLVLANQYLDQFAGNQQAVEGTVGAMIAFEIGRQDAGIMRHYMNTFEPEELINLGKYKAAISLRHKDDRLNSFLVNTAPPIEFDASEAEIQERVERIKRACIRNQKLMPYDEIIRWINRRYNIDSDDNSNENDGEANDFTEDET